MKYSMSSSTFTTRLSAKIVILSTY